MTRPDRIDRLDRISADRYATLALETDPTGLRASLGVFLEAELAVAEEYAAEATAVGCETERTAWEHVAGVLRTQLARI